MRPDLFGNVVRPSITIDSRTWHTVPFSILTHAVLVAAVIIAPLMAPDVFPVPPAMMAYVAASPAPPPPPPPPPPTRAAASKAGPDVMPAVPVEAPSGIKPDSGLVTTPDASLPGGVESGAPDDVAGSGLNLVPGPPPSPPPTPTAPVRPGGDLRPPTRIKDVQPAYPAIAQSARVQGVVIIEAIIGTDGKVRDAKVLRSIPLLALAVVAAAGVTGAAPSRRDALAARGHAYSLEGAWFGTASIIGLPPMPTMDTLTSSAATPKVWGTFLCTIPPGPYPNPLDPSGWLSVTPSGQGNWKRVARNEYAFTAWRIVMDQTGAVVGTAKYWGVITPLSPNEYSGTMNAEFYRLDGSLLFPVTFTGTLSSNRIEIVID